MRERGKRGGKSLPERDRDVGGREKMGDRERGSGEIKSPRGIKREKEKERKGERGRQRKR